MPDLLKICPDAKIHKSQPDAEGQFDIEDGQIFQVDGATLRAYSTPGHTKDHMVFRLCEEDALFTGDSMLYFHFFFFHLLLFHPNILIIVSAYSHVTLLLTRPDILGHGTSVFEDLEVYLSTLEKMKYYFSGRAYPGHGAVIADGSLKINEYIKHRQQREDEVLQVLVYGSLTAERDGPSSPVNGDELRRWTPMELVKVIYRDVPVTLHVPASQGVFQILKKLEWEGKVVTGENDGEDRFMIVL